MSAAATAVRFEDIAPPEPDGAEAVRYLREWFQDAAADVPGLVALTGLEAPSGRCIGSVFASVPRMIAAIEERGLTGLTYWGVHPANLYSRLWMLGERPKMGRGKADLASWAPGVAVDLDVAEGKFGSTEECLELLRRLHGFGLCPSFIIDSGSGGVHAYWRVAGGLKPATALGVSKRMHVFVRSLVPDVAVDSMADAARVMRLPGSIRFPKRGEGDDARATLCRARWIGAPECVLDLARFREVTAEAWAGERVAAEHRQALRLERDLETRRAVARVRSGLDGGYWGRLMTVADAETMFALAYTWDAILTPLGWTLADAGVPDHRGRRTWTRPGGESAGKRSVSARSLVTDFDPDGAGVERAASLLSMSPETGLLRLHELGIGLSKVAVAAELHRGGDVGALLAEFISSGSVVL